MWREQSSTSDRIDSAGWENVAAVRGDATMMPVGEVDAVLSTFLIGMVETPARAVETWTRRLRPNGRVAILNAGRSNRRVATPINLLLRGFVRLTAPGGRTQATAPVKQLERRWRQARDALFEATVDYRESRYGLGVLRLASGRLPAE